MTNVNLDVDKIFNTWYFVKMNKRLKYPDRPLGEPKKKFEDTFRLSEAFNNIETPFLIDARVGLIKMMVNTLLVSKHATEKNKYYKISQKELASMREAVVKSNRFNDDEKNKLHNLIDIAYENPNDLIQIGGTFGKDATIINVIDFYISSISTRRENFEEMLENSTPINLDY